MPELAAAYLIGMILTLCLMGVHLFLQLRKHRSQKMRQVQANLQKINLFWSDSESAIKERYHSKLDGESDTKECDQPKSGNESDIKQSRVDADEGDPEKNDVEKEDLEKSIRSILISGIGFAFLSWLGLFLQFVLMASLRYLAVKRIEIRLFESELAEKDLIAEKSRDLVTKIMQS